MKTRLLFLLLLVTSVGPTLASETSVDGIWYDFDADTRTAFVTYHGQYSGMYTNEYTGSVIIPSYVSYNSVKYSVIGIGESAFGGCPGLTNVTIPNSVKRIGYGAFGGCSSLTSVTIPNSVTDIGPQAFSSCSNLKSVTLNSDTIVGSANMLNLFGEQVTEYIIGTDVTSIGDAVFKDCSGIKSVTIPNSVTSIGKDAFYGCQALASVAIPNSVTYIGWMAFRNCINLAKVTIGNGITCIPKYAFSGCYALDNLDIPNSVTSIEPYAFHYCTGLAKVTIPNSVKTIGNYAFNKCSALTSVTIPNSVTKIGEAAFSYSGLNSITIPNSVTSIEAGAFYGCSSLTGITFPDSTTIDINSNTFYMCSSLESVVIPNGVTRIRSCAFAWCTGLKSVVFPNSVTQIQTTAFAECSNLTSITCEAVSPPTCGDGAFDNVKRSIPLYVPDKAKYQKAEVWKEFTNIQNYYTITFVDWEGTLLQSIQVKEGEMPRYTGLTPVRNSDEYYTYEFYCWTPNIVAATKNATYRATYKGFPKGDYNQAEQTSNTSVAVAPNSTGDGSVVIEWSEVTGATTYVIQILKSRELICTLTFNENGQLRTTIWGSPARDRNSRDRVATTQTSNGWRYVLNGLEFGATYRYTITAKNDTGNILFEHSGNFTMPAAEGFESVDALDTPQKILRDGQVLIQKGDKTYTLTGQEVK